MTIITKQDLALKDYSWNAIPPDNPKVTGQPDSTLLNRMEGYEVLPFINRFCKNNNLQTKPSALKVEKMIRAHPGSVRSHANVTAWIKSNWNAY